MTNPENSFTPTHTHIALAERSAMASLREAEHELEQERGYLQGLVHLRRAASDVEAATRWTAMRARQDGATWQQVADALSITKQAAQQRFGRVAQ